MTSPARFLRFFRRFFFAFFFLAIHDSRFTIHDALACPMCAAGSSDMAERYSASVALLSYLPIGVTAVLGLLIYRSVRRR